MIRRNFLVLAASSALILPGLLQAQDRSAAGTVRATAAQIDELLRGNTITGTWGIQYGNGSGPSDSTIRSNAACFAIGTETHPCTGTGC